MGQGYDEGSQQQHRGDLMGPADRGSRTFGDVELAWDAGTVWVSRTCLVGRFARRGWEWWPLGRRQGSTSGAARPHDDPRVSWTLFCLLFSTLTHTPMPAAARPTWIRRWTRASARWRTQRKAMPSASASGTTIRLTLDPRRAAPGWWAAIEACPVARIRALAESLRKTGHVLVTDAELQSLAALPGWGDGPVRVGRLLEPPA
ncbi:MAG: hypothetical protein KTR31_27635 [Myxococcales bacterium]|nr:hypothetical protein [Myxococcales bacterium]